MLALLPFRNISWILAFLAIVPCAQPLVQDSTRPDARTVSQWPPPPPGAPLGIRDSIGRIREILAFSQLKDSLNATQRRAQLADSSTADDRPGRAYLRNIDSSLFSSHSGSIGNEYPLGPGDVLILSIWGQKQARYDLEIDRDGQVQIPSVGAVSLNGVTFKEAKSLLTRRMMSVYSGLQSGMTQIDLTLQKLKQVRVFVVGDVSRPGGYVLSGTSSGLQAVAIAGGPTTRGSERIVKVTRGDSTHDVDLYKYLFLGRRPQRDVLQDGDVVRVLPALGTVRVEGSVSRPGRYEVLPTESVADLLALAGGPSPNCDPEAPVRLSRERSGSRTTNLVGTAGRIDAVGGSFAVQPGDVVSIRSQTNARRASPVVTGFVRHPGEYPYESGLTVRKLVAAAGGPSRGALLRRVILIRSDSLGAGSVQDANIESGPDVLVFPSDSLVVPGQVPSDSLVRLQISGAVRRPGVYEWYKGIRLTDLVLLAGGTESWADRRNVRLSERSPSGGEIRTKSISLDSGAADQSDPYLLPYSQVSVPASRERPNLLARVRLTGQVRSPETYTLLSAKERLSSVVRRAGGLDSIGYPEGAVLWRPAEGRIPTNLAKALDHPGSADDIVLQGDDSIHVPQRPATVIVAGMVNRPTRALWRKGKDWSWYVEAAGDFADSANREGVYVQYADGSIQSLSQGPDDPTPGSIVYVPRREPPKPATTVEKISAFATIVTAIATLVTVYVLYSNSSH